MVDILPFFLLLAASVSGLKDSDKDGTGAISKQSAQTLTKVSWYSLYVIITIAAMSFLACLALCIFRQCRSKLGKDLRVRNIQPEPQSIVPKESAPKEQILEHNRYDWDYQTAPVTQSLFMDVSAVDLQGTVPDHHEAAGNEHDKSRNLSSMGVHKKNEQVQVEAIGNLTSPRGKSRTMRQPEIKETSEQLRSKETDLSNESVGHSSRPQPRLYSRNGIVSRTAKESSNTDKQQARKTLQMYPQKLQTEGDVSQTEIALSNIETTTPTSQMQGVKAIIEPFEGPKASYGLPNHQLQGSGKKKKKKYRNVTYRSQQRSSTIHWENGAQQDMHV